MTGETREEQENRREVAPTSVWVISDEGPAEEGEYVADGSGWYNKDGSGSIMWRSDIDLREVHDNPNLNGIWIRDERGSGRNVGCTENNDPDDVTICTEWRDNYGHEDVVAFRIEVGEGDRGNEGDRDDDEVAEARGRIAWADRAFQLRGSQEDYDRVLEADDPEEEFHAIKEGDAEDGHLGDEDLDLDAVREMVAEMADSFAGSQGLFKGLEKSVAKEYEEGCNDCIEESLNKFRRYAKFRRMDEEEIGKFIAVADLFVAALQQNTVGDEGDHHGDEGDDHGDEGDDHGDEGDDHGEEGDHHGDEGDDHGDEGDDHGDEGDDHGDEGDDHEDEWSSGPNSVRLVLKSMTDGIVEVDIEVAESEPISGWSMRVNYDPDILQFKSFTPKFVKGAFIPLSMESAEGVEVGGAVLGMKVAKTEGDGILGTIKLAIVGTLPCKISLANPSFRGVDSDVILEQEPLEIAP
ncbi:cohesin domain-containing protein [Candidatus Latescibacteria bacterium]|nr:cohesin domain-containing protein [Candidatus Latescibacterota bacterium]